MPEPTEAMPGYPMAKRITPSAGLTGWSTGGGVLRRPMRFGMNSGESRGLTGSLRHRLSGAAQSLSRCSR